MADAVFIKALLHPSFHPLRNWSRAERLAEDFLHDFQFAPFGMLAAESLFSDFAVKLADFEAEQDFLLPGHERLHEESTVPVTIVSDRHNQDVTTAPSIIIT